MTRREGRIDDRGFLVAAPTPHLIVRRRPARWGMEWTVAEDRFLIRRLREFEIEGHENPLRELATELERSYSAVEVRLAVLRAGVRLAQDRP